MMENVYSTFWVRLAKNLQILTFLKAKFFHNLLYTNSNQLEENTPATFTKFPAQYLKHDR